MNTATLPHSKSMQQVTTITREGRLTIPRAIRRRVGIEGDTKVAFRIEGRRIIVEPKEHDFWQLSGSLKSRVKLTDAQLKHAREIFTEKWARQV